MKKKIPDFESEEQERKFWSAHDSTDFVDWSKSERIVFPNLKQSTRTISLRIPESMLAELRQIANKRDIPYQSLIKTFLRDRIDDEYHNRTGQA